MGNSLRCCLACVLPCGALDLVRIVHLNGQVDEFSYPISAAKILEANPNHLLSKPCYSQGTTKKIVIVSADAELKRGNIYFLIPKSSLPSENKKKDHTKKRHNNNSSGTVSTLDHDNYLRDVLSEKNCSSHRRRRGARVGVWRPQLESILEKS
uniref:Uncharacterized protein n=1 Tax=Ananas comosus var. bracteatus TaxID=296719 RepID=A0A6V7QRU4_ANACO